MKKIFTLILIATLFIGCSSDDGTPTAQQPVEVEQEATMYVYIVATNAKQLVGTIIRNDVEIPVKTEWITQRKIPVKNGDVLIITSNGEVTTDEKELFVSVIDEFNMNINYVNGMVGYELKYYNQIGKESI